MTARPAALLAALLLTSMLVACGDAGEVVPQPSGPEAGASSSIPSPTPAATESTAPTPAATAFDGPAAPDFSLALENRSGTYTLSAVDRPVYLVFWAEW